MRGLSAPIFPLRLRSATSPKGRGKGFLGGIEMHPICLRRYFSFRVEIAPSILPLPLWTLPRAGGIIRT